MEWNASAKLSEFIWINGKVIPWDEAYIHVLTHSLHYSGAVFEGERAYNGKIFKLTEHTNRLLKSAASMQLSIKYSLEEIKAATKAILQKNNLQNAYIRPLIWRGAESLGAYNPVLTTNLLIFATESNPEFRNGLRLWVSPWRKIAENAIPVQAKSSTHYAMLSISQQLAQDAGYDDALLLDQFDDIAECTTTNIFFGREGELVTPVADRFLNGLTRQTVIELARNMGIRVREERLLLEDIKKYDTCFVTGTSAEIRGVSSIHTGEQTMKFANDKIVTTLQHEYAKIVGKIL
ncbi:MAG: branched-chain amino acid transaminase [Rickettsiaceae bacterium]|nr:branched-chain amino acid transaminase [Rickettsiaceae bacterium]MDP4832115.1 branched-chain amino acid transaminase [Rickettsiaceae bacterium]MDP5020311.1 branched-chain amino acid transaminase [Rickettsiaceae bacterium]MDP5082631.1 branched-chain amino acid transaminase [Rickettsiaceae bacterium]